MDGSTAILLIGLGLAALFVVPAFLRARRRERATAEAEALARRYGLHEPLSLHPVVSAEACIGTGSCTAVCPEGDVLGIRNGQAIPVSPARCIGHGLCERACPVEAIELVFGSATRGVDLPRIRENFETNVPGLYIVGELGGMGLIRNAFTQGRQCIDGIARAPRAPRDMLDVVIVGCGPAGLAASLNCMEHGLRFVTVEREDIGGTVRYFPRKKIVMTAPVAVPLYGKLSFRELPKEQLIGVWEDIVRKTGLEVRTQESVTAVDREPAGSFLVTTARTTYRARHVVLAIGRRGVPRKLGVPGEDLPKVIYSLLEPEAYRGDRVLVVGGGDSAVEAALALSEEPDTRVRMSYRREAFSRIKPRNHDRITAAIEDRRLEMLWKSEVTEIAPTAVAVRTADGDVQRFANDTVAIFAGGELPTKFLAACGVQIDTKFGEP